MGKTLLMLAISRPIYRDISKNLAILLETVRFLIKAGANLNIQEVVSLYTINSCMHGEHLVLFNCTDWKNCSHFCCYNEKARTCQSPD